MIIMWRSNAVLISLCIITMVAFCFLSCSHALKKPKEEHIDTIQFSSSNPALTDAFNWAKTKALSFAHDGSDPVGLWYEAALPNREAFCMRDVSHQAIGAELLGLGEHNYNMLYKFAENISEEKDYCSFWEINRHNKAAPVDYETDHDFWYNLPANFDIIFTAYRLYQWTGNEAYLVDPTLNNFYKLSLNEYVQHWALNANKIINRDRSLHILNDSKKSRFGNKRGIPTYNEGGRGETLMGIDMTASLIAAYTAYAELLKSDGKVKASNEYLERSKIEQEFLNNFWWDEEIGEFRSILYEDKTFDYFMVGDNQAFIHYLLYFNVLKDQEKIRRIVNQYAEKYPQLIVELKSYLPIIFYENGYSTLATDMLIQLCSIENQRRDYPENSFTVIEHLTRGLMGINVDARSNSFTTYSRVGKNNDWAELKNIPVLANKISVIHNGHTNTTAFNVRGKTIKWIAKFQGSYDFLYVNGIKRKCTISANNGETYSYIELELKEGQRSSISINKLQ